ncbi:MAG: DAK2 domain-containing protein [Chloroflexi bacterium]|nr:DAK2 domain-containing protein [Chloroflexota bacterium]
MRRTDSISGRVFKEMFTTATAWLEKDAADIDALNVFPVPDGDCGTNMLLTMRSAIEEAQNTDNSVSRAAEAMARGALMGARGNSGVILSQVWRGIAQALAGKDTMTAHDLANALSQAAQTAYDALTNPVEGTILTVIRDVAEASQTQAKSDKNDLVSVLETAVATASESVANTPRLLPALKEAGVVDAGGQGLHTILDGALRYLKGEAEMMQFRKPQLIASNIPMTLRATPSTEKEEPFGYCTEFLIKGEKLKPGNFRRKLKRKGLSLIVVGDKTTVRVHIHTLDPGEIIHLATSLGALHQVSIRNMDEQHQAYLEMQKQRLPAVDIATAAVVPGDGLVDIFNSLGVSVVIPGGQTMNPSTKEILRAIESLHSDKVIILPNNKNIVPAANQVKRLTKKQVEVVPTETIPQGVAALLAFDYEADFETNARIMEQAKSSVKSVEITRAMRSAKLGGLKIKRHQFIGFLDGSLVAVGDDATSVLNEALNKVDLRKAEVITIYHGTDKAPPEAEQLSQDLREQYPNLQIEVVRGAQPHYDYIVSVE